MLIDSLLITNFEVTKENADKYSVGHCRKRQGAAGYSDEI
jgi:hypothetical protein